MDPFKMRLAINAYMAAASRNGEGVGDLPKPLVVLEIDIFPISTIKPNDYNVF